MVYSNKGAFSSNIIEITKPKKEIHIKILIGSFSRFLVTLKIDINAIRIKRKATTGLFRKLIPRVSNVGTDRQCSIHRNALIAPSLSAQYIFFTCVICEVIYYRLYI